MAGIPQNFSAVSNVLANYDFVDIASGTGYINFYAGTTVDLKLLSNFTFYSDTIVETAATGSEIVYTLRYDHDFDVLLNRPIDLAGLGIVNIPVFTQNPNGAIYSDLYATVILRKWTGAVETDIISNDSSVQSIVNTSQYKMLAVDLNVPITHFKKGEYIRLSIMIYSRIRSAGSVTTYQYAHDPLNRVTGWDATGAVPSKLTFQCPVRLNL